MKRSGNFQHNEEANSHLRHRKDRRHGCEDFDTCDNVVVSEDIYKCHQNSSVIDGRRYEEKVDRGIKSVSDNHPNSSLVKSITKHCVVYGKTDEICTRAIQKSRAASTTADTETCSTKSATSDAFDEPKDVKYYHALAKDITDIIEAHQLYAECIQGTFPHSVLEEHSSRKELPQGESTHARYSDTLTKFPTKSATVRNSDRSCYQADTDTSEEDKPIEDNSTVRKLVITEKRRGMGGEKKRSGWDKGYREPYSKKSNWTNGLSEDVAKASGEQYLKTKTDVNSLRNLKSQGLLNAVSARTKSDDNHKYRHYAPNIPNSRGIAVPWK